MENKDQNSMKSDTKFFHKAFINSHYSNSLLKINIQQSAKEKINLFKAGIKKIVILDRNPPSPYSIERMNTPLFFKISPNESLMEIDNFLRIYKDLLQSDDEDFIVKS